MSNRTYKKGYKAAQKMIQQYVDNLCKMYAKNPESEELYYAAVAWHYELNWLFETGQQP